MYAAELSTLNVVKRPVDTQKMDEPANRSGFRYSNFVINPTVILTPRAEETTYAIVWKPLSRAERP
jgi:agmatine/peptidylarginine deiminase